MIKDFFRKFSQKTTEFVGSPISFMIVLILLLLWEISGLVFGFSEKWQLIITTTPTIITFLMVFLIQNTQNRDTKATHLKLDELILSMHGARNKLVNLEELSDEELDRIQKQFRRISEHYSKLTNSAEEIEVARDKNLPEEEKD